MTVIGNKGQELRFFVYRDSMQISDAPVMIVRASNDNDEQPVTFAFVDAPSISGSYQYSIKAAGFGSLSVAGRARQFGAVVVPYAEFFTSRSFVDSWSSSVDLAPQVFATSSDRVLVLLTMCVSNASQTEDFQLQLLRGATAIGTYAAFGTAASGTISTSLGHLDDPGQSATQTYSVSMVRGMGSTGVVSKYAEIRSLLALPVPRYLTYAYAFTSAISYSSSTWSSMFSFSLSLSATTDKVFFMLNADLMFPGPSPNTVCITIFRGNQNLGDATRGLLTVNAGPVSGRRRSPMLIHIDSPSTTGSVIYSLSVKSVNTQSYEFGNGGSRQTSFIYIVLDEPPAPPTVSPTMVPIPAPTMIPSRAPTMVPSAVPTTPTAKPTAKPTPVPTSAPTGVLDCSAISPCSIVSNAQFKIAQNRTHDAAVLVLPTFFQLQVMFRNVTLATTPSERRNIFDIVDASSGQSLLSVYTKITPDLEVRYSGAMMLNTGYNLVAPLATEWTTLSITVTNKRLIMTTSATGMPIEVTVPSNVVTSGRQYRLYLSNPSAPSAGGTMYSISSTGTDSITLSSKHPFLSRTVHSLICTNVFSFSCLQ